MYRPLVPCPSCTRHVRVTEASCPFCSAALPDNLASRAIPASPVRLSRAAAFVFGATLAMTGCTGDVTDTGGSGGAGGATPDAGPDDDGGTVALYGEPAPEDAGTDGPDDDGGNMAEYGAPAPTDAGPDGPEDDGGAQPLYGAAPDR